jgi:hypothetical protein
MAKSKSGVPARTISSGTRVNGAALEAAGARVNYGYGDGRPIAPLSDAERDALMAVLAALDAEDRARRVK